MDCRFLRAIRRKKQVEGHNGRWDNLAGEREELGEFVLTKSVLHSVMMACL